LNCVLHCKCMQNTQWYLCKTVFLVPRLNTCKISVNYDYWYMYNVQTMVLVYCVLIGGMGGTSKHQPRCISTMPSTPQICQNSRGCGIYPDPLKHAGPFLPARTEHMTVGSVIHSARGGPTNEMRSRDVRQMSSSKWRTYQVHPAEARSHSAVLTGNVCMLLFH